VPVVIDNNADWSQLIWLGAVVLLLFSVGFVGISKRDIERI